jgi:hypothetical protein
MARLRHAERIEQCPSLKGKAENIQSLRVFRILTRSAHWLICPSGHFLSSLIFCFSENILLHA